MTFLSFTRFCRLELSRFPHQIRPVNQAFILGAGLGTRLRPLTDRLPKPLIPLFHQPLAWWAMEACSRANLRRFAVNTHHLPDAWRAFSAAAVADTPHFTGGNGLPADSRIWNGKTITFFHEPILLETGGGLKNISSWIGEEPLLIHNGDIFSTMPLGKLIAAHEASGQLVTLALRSVGKARHISLDASMTRVTDIHGKLGRAAGTHVFSGIYCVSPRFLEMLPAGEKISVIPAFLELAKHGGLGAIVLDDGEWLDLGDRESYLLAHQTLDLAPAIHPLATVEAGAIIENSIIGPGAVIESGAVVKNSVVWPQCRVARTARLDHCIIYSEKTAAGVHQQADL